MEKLVKLSKKAVPTFIDLYTAAKYPRHAVTCAALKNYVIQKDKFPNYYENLELLTLNDEWQKDGLFLIKNGRSFYFDSLEPQPFDRLKDLLFNIDYSSQVVFRAVRDHFKPMINDLLWLKNLEITDQTGTTVYWIPKEKLAKLPTQPIPEGWKFRLLTIDDKAEVDSKVQREGGDSIGYIENSLKYKLCLGLFDDKNSLQGWVLGVDLGTHGTLMTANEHQQKGIAGAVGVTFGKMVLQPENGEFDSIWNVDHGNEKSQGLARKFGAIGVDTVTWMAVNKRVSSKMSQMGMYQIFYPKL